LKVMDFCCNIGSAVTLRCKNRECPLANIFKSSQVLTDDLKNYTEKTKPVTLNHKKGSCGKHKYNGSSNMPVGTLSKKIFTNLSFDSIDYNKVHVATTWCK
jgi:hypothetical protein